jgi:hypothetical protein
MKQGTSLDRWIAGYGRGVDLFYVTLAKHVRGRIQLSIEHQRFSCIFRGAHGWTSGIWAAWSVSSLPLLPHSLICRYRHGTSYLVVNFSLGDSGEVHRTNELPTRTKLLGWLLCLGHLRDSSWTTLVHMPLKFSMRMGHPKERLRMIRSNRSSIISTLYSEELAQSTSRDTPHSHRQPL